MHQNAFSRRAPSETAAPHTASWMNCMEGNLKWINFRYLVCNTKLTPQCLYSEYRVIINADIRTHLCDSTSGSARAE